MRKNKAAQELARLSHKKSPRSLSFYKRIGRKGVKKKFAGMTKEEISEYMRRVRNRDKIT